jgi:hypothetical protein
VNGNGQIVLSAADELNHEGSSFYTASPVSGRFKAGKSRQWNSETLDLENDHA